MKTTLAIILLLVSVNLIGQTETTIDTEYDPTENKGVLLDSLLTVFNFYEIFVITKVEEKRLFIRQLNKRKSFPIRKDDERNYKVGYYLTVK